jgi:ABC-2 type transport system ATP-binding protein
VQGRTVIYARGLGKRFGSFEAVRALSLDVAAGEVLALLGPNGAGKTTTVRMLAAILRPTTGCAVVAGHDVVAEAQHVRGLVGLLTEFPGLYGRMRPLDYLQFFGDLQGLSRAQSRLRAEALLRRFDLWDARTRRLDAYSKGMKQKMALIRALLHDPPILFLDEPTTAMDPHSARTVRDAIADLRAQRRTILLTTHNLPEAEDLADRIAVVRAGTIIAQGTRDELSRQLMGEPLWELRLGKGYPDAARLLEGLADLEDGGIDWLRYRCSDPQAINPQIARRVLELGLPLVALSEVPRSLEDVYLTLMDEGPAASRPQPEALGAQGSNAS